MTAIMEDMDIYTAGFRHTPVLFDECLDGLNIRPGGTYVDGTAGGGSHLLGIAERMGGSGALIGIDRDISAVLASCAKLSGHTGICTVVHGNFRDIRRIMGNLGIRSADGILLDLGVSSRQLDDPSRGFSYMSDTPLDMRMDTRGGLSARDVVNGYPQNELSRIIYKYGEERWAKRIAEFIAAARRKKPVETTLELVSLIKAAIPERARESGQHPARRTFQAIRIEVNGELSILEGALNDMAGLLNPGGRLCAISFHSLEDRIVKSVFKRLESPCECPRDYPCVCGRVPSARVVTRKPLEPSAEEVGQNGRARSAKLRILEKL